MKKLLSLVILSAIVGANIPTIYAAEKPVLNAGAEEVVDVYGKSGIKTNKHSVKKVVPHKNKYDYINMAWWQQFNDEKLNDYIIKAIENNKDLKMASLNVEECYQGVVAQRADELPSISAGFLPGYGKFIGPSAGGFAIPLIANYELDLWGKNHNKTTAMRKLYEATILDEQSAYISIAAAVGAVYVNIVKLDAMIDLQEDIVNLRKEIFEMMTISNIEGIVSTSDLVKANQSYISGVADLSDLKKERTKLLHNLAVLTGDSPNNIEEYQRISYEKLVFSGIIPETVSSEIIMNRPDYLRAEKMLEKAGIDVKIARKEMLPKLSLGGGVLFNSKYFESLFTTSNMLWGLGGAVIQPAFMGGKLKANLKSKKIAYEKSLKNYEKTNLTSLQEVNDTLVSISMDKEKLSRQRNIKDLEEKDFKLTQYKYSEGVIAKLDLNQKQENLLNIKKLVYNTEFDCMVDYISFYKAIAAQSI